MKPQERSSMFLSSDIDAAAEFAAQQLAPYLLPEQLEALSQELVDTMHTFVRKVRDEEST